MAVHANLTNKKLLLPKSSDLSAVELNIPWYLKVDDTGDATTGYTTVELQAVYGGYNPAPLNRGSQISLLDGSTLLDFQVESELDSGTGDGHAHFELPRHFGSKLSGDSGVDNVLNIIDTSGINFQVNDWVGISNDDGGTEVNQITGISAGQITFLNNFSQDWTTAKNSYIAYGAFHNYGGDSGATQSDKEGTWNSGFEFVNHANVTQLEGVGDDATNHNNNLTIFGSQDAAGQIDRGLVYTLNDRDTAPDSASLSIGPNISIELWVDVTEDGTTIAMISKAVFTGAQRSYWLVRHSSNKIRWSTSSAGTSGTNDVLNSLTDFIISSGRIHIGVSKTAADQKLYINGELDNFRTPDNATIFDSTALLELGSQDAGSNFWEGGQDERTISSVERSADWFKARYRSGAGTWVTFGAAEINIPVSVDALTLTEFPAIITLPVNVLATVDALTLTEFPATVNAATNIAAGLDALTLTEFPATISLANDINVAATVDALTLTEFPATITLPVNVLATVDVLTLTEYAATITRPFIGNKFIPRVVLSDSSLARPQKVVIE